MKKILDFLSKYAFVINIILFVLSFVLFFLPLNTIPWKKEIPGVKSYSTIMYIVQNGIDIPEYCLDYCVVYLLFFLLLWIAQVASIVLSKNKPVLSIVSLLPFTGIFIYTIYLFADNTMIPHIGFIIMLILFCFYVFESVIFLIPKLPSHREHKLTDKEHIAQLEKRISELEERDVI